MIATTFEGCLDDGFFVLKATDLHSAKIALLCAVNMEADSDDGNDSKVGLEMRNPAALPFSDGTKGQGPVVLDTSNIAKYRVGQHVSGMGNTGSISGTISAIIGDVPFATSGRGKLTIQQTPQPQVAQQTPQPQVAQAVPSPFCANCGAKQAGATAFCIQCGAQR